MKFYRKKGLRCEGVRVKHGTQERKNVAISVFPQLRVHFFFRANRSNRNVTYCGEMYTTRHKQLKKDAAKIELIESPFMGISLICDVLRDDICCMNRLQKRTGNFGSNVLAHSDTPIYRSYYPSRLLSRHVLLQFNEFWFARITTSYRPMIMRVGRR